MLDTRTVHSPLLPLLHPSSAASAVLKQRHPPFASSAKKPWLLAAVNGQHTRQCACDLPVITPVVPPAISCLIARHTAAVVFGVRNDERRGSRNGPRTPSGFSQRTPHLHLLSPHSPGAPGGYKSERYDAARRRGWSAAPARATTVTTTQHAALARPGVLPLHFCQLCRNER